MKWCHGLGAVLMMGTSGCLRFEMYADEACQSGPAVEPAAPYECEAALVRYLEDETAFDSFVLVDSTGALMTWGDVQRPSNVASIRKSIISVLYGVAVEDGLIDVHDSLADLGFDDQGRLTEQEKSATIQNLLQARSGVYLPAIGENPEMKELRPDRGEHQPGEHWYYNNWDYNALGLIFEQETGLTIGEATQEWIAKPLGMQSFCPEHVTYESSSYTDLPMWRINMSSEDLGQIALAFVGDDTDALVSPEWVDESMQSYSKMQESFFSGYGYLWWIHEETGTVWADGYGGQYMAIDPHSGLAIVARNHTSASVAGYIWFKTARSGEGSQSAALDLLKLARECQK